MAFVTEGSVCNLEVTGKEYEGETSIVFEGALDELNLVLSKKVGWHIDAPDEVLNKFEQKNLAVEGSSLVSKNFANAKCKIRLNLSAAPGKMTVEWD